MKRKHTIESLIVKYFTEKYSTTDERLDALKNLGVPGAPKFFRVSDVCFATLSWGGLGTNLETGKIVDLPSSDYELLKKFSKSHTPKWTMFRSTYRKIREELKKSI